MGVSIIFLLSLEHLEEALDVLIQRKHELKSLHPYDREISYSGNTQKSPDE
jgi:hypothetical protein